MGDVVQLPVVNRRNRSAPLTAMSAVKIEKIGAAYDQAVAEGAIDEVERLGNLLNGIGRERRLAGLPDRPAA